MSAMARDPITPAEWQEAVDLAEFYLALDSARLYGFVTFPGAVDAGRCEVLLERGRARGIRPRPDAIERAVAAFYRSAPEADSRKGSPNGG